MIKIKIPKKLKVIGHEFSISIENKETDFLGAHLGALNFDKRKIEILDYVDKEETFLHEIVHILFKFSSLKHSEMQCDLVASMLLQIIPQIAKEVKK